jgi:hypothetical protein
MLLVSESVYEYAGYALEGGYDGDGAALYEVLL